ncbi:MAG: hypothetical protein AAF846_20525 [Chloroflexota bacterium]
MDNTTLIMIGVIATLILFVYYVWNAVFFRSWRKVIFLVLGTFLEATKRVDETMDIEPSDRAKKSEGMKAQADTLDFDVALEQSKPPLPQQATIPATETGEFARVTSDNGWPRDLDETTRGDSRPFRTVHLNTENDDIPTKVEHSDNKQSAVLDSIPESIKQRGNKS